MRRSMQKRIWFILTLSVVAVLVITIGLLGIMNIDKHRILTKKFYIPINESYEIIFFENDTGDDLKKHCYSELKVSESEYDEFESEIKKSEYLKEPLDWYDIYFENNNDWLCGEKIVAAYSKHVVETRYIMISYRIHINLFVTESIDGYRYIYMARN